MKALFYILPILVGVAISIQSGVNSQLRVALNNPLLAAFVSFVTGTIALAILMLFSKQSYPALSVFSTIEWYKLTGGLLGVFVVTVVLLSVQQIGAGNMFVLIIAGQLLTAVLLDHYGLLGLKTSPMNLQKICGVLLLIAGAYLVTKK